MEIFEVITLPLSFIVGLGTTQILASVVRAIRCRKERPLHWLPLGWAASIFMFHVQYWFAIYGQDEAVNWTWGSFFPVLLLAGLIFLSGGLVLPSRSDHGTPLLNDFHEHGRLALLPLAAYLLVWVPINLRDGASLFGPANVADLVIAALILVAFLTKRPFAEVVTFLLVAVGQSYATVFIWAPSVLQ